MGTNPISLRFPFELNGQPAEIQAAHRYAFSGIVDLNQAIAALTDKVNTLQPTSSSGGSSTSTFVSQTIITTAFPGLGGINDQTGNTAYTTTTADNGIFLILNDASPVAVTLNSAMVTPYFFFATNSGTGTVTLTPTSGLINGGGSWPMPEGGLFLVAFDGTNWKTSDGVEVPQTFTAITHQFLNSYDASTGLFTAAQPAFTDISGVATTAQIGTGTPAAGKYVDGGTGAWTPIPATSINFADNETPSGTINGSNVTFTLAHTPSPAGSLELFLNGLVQNRGTDYTLSTNTVTFASAPTTGSTLLAWYRY